MQVTSAMEEQDGETVVKRLSVPVGLEELMSGLTREVLKKKPKDVYTFASEHFAQLLALRDNGNYYKAPAKTFAFVGEDNRLLNGNLRQSRSSSGGSGKQLSRQVSIRAASPTRKSRTKRSGTPKHDGNNNNEGKIMEKQDKNKSTPNRRQTPGSKNRFDNLEPVKEDALKIIAKKESLTKRSTDRKTKDSSSSTDSKRSSSEESETLKKKNSDKLSTPKKSMDGKDQAENFNEAKGKAKKKRKEAKTEESAKYAPKSSSVEEGTTCVKDGRLTVTPPKIIKDAQIPTDQFDLPTTLVVPVLATVSSCLSEGKKEDESGEDLRKDLKNDSETGEILSLSKEGTQDSGSTKYDSLALREELKKVEEEAKLNNFTSSYNPYKLRQEIKNASGEASLENVDALGEESAIIESQSPHVGLTAGLQHSGELHDILIPDASEESSAEDKQILEDKEDLSSKDLKKIVAIGLQHSGELHDSLIPKEKELDSEIIKDEKPIETIKTPIGLQHSSELHDTVLPKEIETDSRDGKNEKDAEKVKTPLGLQHSGELHDTMIPKEIEESKEMIKDNKKTEGLEECQQTGTSEQPKKVETSAEKETSVAELGFASAAAAATKIQSFWRGFSVRKTRKSKVDELVDQHKVQESEISANMRNISDEAMQAATKIQAGVRGYLTRKQQKNEIPVERQTKITDQNESKLSDEELHKALAQLDSLPVPQDSPKRHKREVDNDLDDTVKKMESNVFNEREDNATADKLTRSKSVRELESGKLSIPAFSKSFSVTDSAISKTLDEDEEKLRSLTEDTESLGEQTEDLGIESEISSALETGKVTEEPENLKAVEESTKIADNELPSSLQHTGELHDTVIPKKSKFIKTDDSLVIDEQENNHIHSNISAETAQTLSNKASSSDVIEESAMSKQLPQLASTTGLQHSGELHDFLEPKETDEKKDMNIIPFPNEEHLIPNIKDQHNEIKLYDNTLQDNREQHDTVIPKEVEVKEEALQDNRTLTTGSPQLTEEKRDSAATNESDKISPNQQKDESMPSTALQHSSELHDTVIPKEVEVKEETLQNNRTLITAAPQLAEEERDSVATKESDKINLDQQRHKNLPPTALQHSSEMHDTVIPKEGEVKEETLQDNRSLTSPQLTEKKPDSAATRQSEKISPDQQRDKSLPSFALQHDSELHDIVLAKEIKEEVLQDNKGLTMASPQVNEEHHDIAATTEIDIIGQDPKKRLTMTSPQLNEDERDSTSTTKINKISQDPQEDENLSPTALQQSSKPQDTMIPKQLEVKEEVLQDNKSLTMAIPLLNEDERDRASAKEIDKINSDPHKDESLPSTALQHSSELHDTVIPKAVEVKEEVLQDHKGLTMASSQLNEEERDRASTKETDKINSNPQKDESLPSTALQHSSELHDTVIPKEVEVKKEVLQDNKSLTMASPQSNDDERDRASAKETDKINSHPQKDESLPSTALQHSSELHDTVIPKEVEVKEEVLQDNKSLTMASPRLNEEERDRASTKETDKINSDPQKDESLPSTALQHSSELHDTVIPKEVEVKEEVLQDNKSLTMASPQLNEEERDRASTKETDKINSHPQKDESLPSTALQHSSELHDTVIPKEVEVKKEVLQDNKSLTMASPQLNEEERDRASTKETDKINSDPQKDESLPSTALQHSSELHDTVIPKEVEVKEEVLQDNKSLTMASPQSNEDERDGASAKQTDKINSDPEKDESLPSTALQHSSELHDTVIPKEVEVKEEVLQDNKSLTMASPQLNEEERDRASTKETDKINSHPQKDESLPSTALQHSSELHDTVIPKEVEVKKEVLQDNKSLTMASPQSNDDERDRASAKETDKINSDPEKDESLPSTALQHSSELHDTVIPKEVEVKEEVLQDNKSLTMASPQLNEEERDRASTKETDKINSDPQKDESLPSTALQHSSELHDTVIPKEVEVKEEVLQDNKSLTMASPQSNEDERDGASAKQTDKIKSDPQKDESLPSTALQHSSELHDTVIPKEVEVKEEVLQDNKSLTMASPQSNEDERDGASAKENDKINSDPEKYESLPSTALQRSSELHDTVIPKEVEVKEDVLQNPKDLKMASPQLTEDESDRASTKETDKINSDPEKDDSLPSTALQHSSELHDTVIPKEVEVKEEVLQDHKSLTMASPQLPEDESDMVSTKEIDKNNSDPEKDESLPSTVLQHSSELHDSVIPKEVEVKEEVLQDQKGLTMASPQLNEDERDRASAKKIDNINSDPEKDESLPSTALQHSNKLHDTVIPKEVEVKEEVLQDQKGLTMASPQLNQDERDKATTKETDKINSDPQKDESMPSTTPEHSSELHVTVIPKEVEVKEKVLKNNKTVTVTSPQLNEKEHGTASTKETDKISSDAEEDESLPSTALQHSSELHDFVIPKEVDKEEQILQDAKNLIITNLPLNSSLTTTGVLLNEEPQDIVAAKDIDTTHEDLQVHENLPLTALQHSSELHHNVIPKEIQAEQVLQDVKGLAMTTPELNEKPSDTTAIKDESSPSMALQHSSELHDSMIPKNLEEKKRDLQDDKPLSMVTSQLDEEKHDSLTTKDISDKTSSNDLPDDDNSKLHDTVTPKQIEGQEQALQEEKSLLTTSSQLNKEAQDNAAINKTENTSQDLQEDKSLPSVAFQHSSKLHDGIIPKEIQDEKLDLQDHESLTPSHQPSEEPRSNSTLKETEIREDLQENETALQHSGELHDIIIPKEIEEEKRNLKNNTILIMGSPQLNEEEGDTAALKKTDKTNEDMQKDESSPLQQISELHDTEIPAKTLNKNLVVEDNAMSATGTLQENVKQLDTLSSKPTNVTDQDLIKYVDLGTTANQHDLQLEAAPIKDQPLEDYKGLMTESLEQTQKSQNTLITKQIDDNEQQLGGDKGIEESILQHSSELHDLLLPTKIEDHVQDENNLTPASPQQNEKSKVFSLQSETDKTKQEQQEDKIQRSAAFTTSQSEKPDQTLDDDNILTRNYPPDSQPNQTSEEKGLVGATVQDDRVKISSGIEQQGQTSNDDKSSELHDLLIPKEINENSKLLQDVKADHKTTVPNKTHKADQGDEISEAVTLQHSSELHDALISTRIDDKDDQVLPPINLQKSEESSQTKETVENNHDSHERQMLAATAQVETDQHLKHTDSVPSNLQNSGELHDLVIPKEANPQKKHEGESDLANKEEIDEKCEELHKSLVTASPQESEHTTQDDNTVDGKLSKEKNDGNAFQEKEHGTKQLDLNASIDDVLIPMETHIKDRALTAAAEHHTNTVESAKSPSSNQEQHLEEKLTTDKQTKIGEKVPPNLNHADEEEPTDSIKNVPHSHESTSLQHSGELHDLIPPQNSTHNKLNDDSNYSDKSNELKSAEVNEGDRPSEDNKSTMENVATTGLQHSGEFHDLLITHENELKDDSKEEHLPLEATKLGIETLKDKPLSAKHKDEELLMETTHSNLETTKGEEQILDGSESLQNQVQKVEVEKDVFIGNESTFHQQFSSSVLDVPLESGAPPPSTRTSTTAASEAPTVDLQRDGNDEHLSIEADRETKDHPANNLTSSKPFSPIQDLGNEEVSKIAPESLEVENRPVALTPSSSQILELAPGMTTEELSAQNQNYEQHVDDQERLEKLRSNHETPQNDRHNAKEDHKKHESQEKEIQGSSTKNNKEYDVHNKSLETNSDFVDSVGKMKEKDLSEIDSIVDDIKSETSESTNVNKDVKELAKTNADRLPTDLQNNTSADSMDLKTKAENERPDEELDKATKLTEEIILDSKSTPISGENDNKKIDAKVIPDRVEPTNVQSTHLALQTSRDNNKKITEETNVQAVEAAQGDARHYEILEDSKISLDNAKSEKGESAEINKEVESGAVSTISRDSAVVSKDSLNGIQVIGDKHQAAKVDFEHINKAEQEPTDKEISTPESNAIGEFKKQSSHSSNEDQKVNQLEDKSVESENRSAAFDILKLQAELDEATKFAGENKNDKVLENLATKENVEELKGGIDSNKVEAIIGKLPISEDKIKSTRAKIVTATTAETSKDNNDCIANDQKNNKIEEASAEDTNQSSAFDISRIRAELAEIEKQIETGEEETTANSENNIIAEKQDEKHIAEVINPKTFDISKLRSELQEVGKPAKDDKNEIVTGSITKKLDKIKEKELNEAEKIHDNVQNQKKRATSTPEPNLRNLEIGNLSTPPRSAERKSENALRNESPESDYESAPTRPVTSDITPSIILNENTQIPSDNAYKQAQATDLAQHNYEEIISPNMGSCKGEGNEEKSTLSAEKGKHQNTIVRDKDASEILPMSTATPKVNLAADPEDEMPRKSLPVDEEQQINQEHSESVAKDKNKIKLEEESERPVSITSTTSTDSAGTVIFNVSSPREIDDELKSHFEMPSFEEKNKSPTSQNSEEKEPQGQAANEKNILHNDNEKNPNENNKNNNITNSKISEDTKDDILSAKETDNDGKEIIKNLTGSDIVDKFSKLEEKQPHETAEEMQPKASVLGKDNTTGDKVANNLKEILSPQNANRSEKPKTTKTNEVSPILYTENKNAINDATVKVSDATTNNKIAENTTDDIINSETSEINKESQITAKGTDSKEIIKNIEGSDSPDKLSTLEKEEPHETQEKIQPIIPVVEKHLTQTNEKHNNATHNKIVKDSEVIEEETPSPQNANINEERHITGTVEEIPIKFTENEIAANAMISKESESIINNKIAEGTNDNITNSQESELNKESQIHSVEKTPAKESKNAVEEIIKDLEETGIPDKFSKLEKEESHKGPHEEPEEIQHKTFVTEKDLNIAGEEKDNTTTDKVTNASEETKISNETPGSQTKEPKITKTAEESAISVTEKTPIEESQSGLAKGNEDHINAVTEDSEETNNSGAVSHNEEREENPSDFRKQNDIGAKSLTANNLETTQGGAPTQETKPREEHKIIQVKAAPMAETPPAKENNDEIDTDVKGTEEEKPTQNKESVKQPLENSDNNKQVVANIEDLPLEQQEPVQEFFLNKSKLDNAVNLLQDQDANLKNQHAAAAATIIQSGYRGYRVRRSLNVDPSEAQEESNVQVKQNDSIGVDDHIKDALLRHIDNEGNHEMVPDDGHPPKNAKMDGALSSSHEEKNEVSSENDNKATGGRTPDLKTEKVEDNENSNISEKPSSERSNSTTLENERDRGPLAAKVLTNQEKAAAVKLEAASDLIATSPPAILLNMNEENLSETEPDDKVHQIVQKSTPEPTEEKGSAAIQPFHNATAPPLSLLHHQKGSNLDKKSESTSPSLLSSVTPKDLKTDNDTITLDEPSKNVVVDKRQLLDNAKDAIGESKLEEQQIKGGSQSENILGQKEGSISKSSKSTEDDNKKTLTEKIMEVASVPTHLITSKFSNENKTPLDAEPEAASVDLSQTLNKESQIGDNSESKQTELVSPRFHNNEDRPVTQALEIVLDQQLALTAPGAVKKEESVKSDGPEYIYIPLKDPEVVSTSKSLSERLQHSGEFHDTVVPLLTAPPKKDKDLNLTTLVTENEHPKQKIDNTNTILSDPTGPEEDSSRYDLVDDGVSPRTHAGNEGTVTKALGVVLDQQLAITTPKAKVKEEKKDSGSKDPEYIYIPLKDPNQPSASEQEDSISGFQDHKELHLLDKSPDQHFQTAVQIEAKPADHHLSSNYANDKNPPVPSTANDKEKQADSSVLDHAATQKTIANNLKTSSSGSAQPHTEPNVEFIPRPAVSPSHLNEVQGATTFIVSANKDASGSPVVISHQQSSNIQQRSESAEIRELSSPTTPAFGLQLRISPSPTHHNIEEIVGSISPIQEGKENSVGSPTLTREDRSVQSESSPVVIQTTQISDNGLPLAVQLNQPPGAAVLTSPTPDDAEASISTDGPRGTAHAPGKAASTKDGAAKNGAHFRTSMETSNRKNATVVEKNMENDAATKIQASFRGYQVRKQLKCKNGGVESVRRSLRRKSSGKLRGSDKASQKCSGKGSDLEEKSATKIQAGVRGFLVRRRQKKAKSTTPESS